MYVSLAYVFVLGLSVLIIQDAKEQLQRDQHLIEFLICPWLMLSAQEHMALVSVMACRVMVFCSNKPPGIPQPALPLLQYDTWRDRRWESPVCGEPREAEPISSQGGLSLRLLRLIAAVCDKHS